MKPSILLLLACLSYSCAYHILCVFPIPSHSHNQLGKGIVDALLKGGHSVTWITPYPEKVGKNPPKTLKVVDVSAVKRFVDGVDMTDRRSMNQGMSFVKAFSRNIHTDMLTSPAFKDLITQVQYDAVVSEEFFSDLNAGIHAIQQVPWILFSAVPMNPILESMVDEVRSISTIPMMFNTCQVPMGFMERAKNLFMYAFMVFGSWKDMPETNRLYESIFTPLATARGVTLPPLDAALHNVSILLLNTHESLYPAFSSPPNVISVAGYHIDPNPPALPKDLQDLMDNSRHGVVYFSLGSVVRSSALAAETRAALLAVFSRLPQTVFWKFEEAIKEKLPPNVHVRSWFPQPSVLGHPKLRVFITHGGQLSTLEAVNAGVPLIAIPVFGDQPANAENARRSGYALKVTFGPDMATELEVQLKEMLNNDSYTQRVKYLSKLFRSRPVAPSDLIKHYIEIAIETKGAHHLRSLSLQYSWHERWMLDVALAVLTALGAVLAALVLTLRFCLRKITGKKTKDIVRKDKKKVKKN